MLIGFHRLLPSSVSLSQIEEVGNFDWECAKDELLSELETVLMEGKHDFACLLITDVQNKDSVLLAVGDSRVLDALEFEKLDQNVYRADGVVSRKMQLFPAVSRALKHISYH